MADEQAPPSPTTEPKNVGDGDEEEDIGDPDVLPETKTTNDKDRIKELEDQLRKSRHSVKQLNERICELEVALLEVEKTLEAISSTPPPPPGSFPGADDGGPPAPPGGDDGGPPPPPPPPGMGGPPPPTGGVKSLQLGPPTGGKKGIGAGGGDTRGALLASIEGFSKGGLKKSKTVDKSGPQTTTPKPSGGGGGGIAALAAGQLKNLKKLEGTRTASGRMSRAQAEQNRAQVAMFANLKKGGGPAPAGGAAPAATPAPGLNVTLRRTGGVAPTPGGAAPVAAAAPAGPAFKLKSSANLDKTKSGRVVPKQATGPPPAKVDWRDQLKKTG
eukprot:TRINITY_DN656_c0_g1_i1.p1 TRINITY_DN656_c0_g1~~TRINITY_DN656_c0_g1_i1.p1  ORF type:complete len:329 (-),score=160.66 TRINITY_DN656_c0_g1_i1:40-1026(-)